MQYIYSKWNHIGLGRRRKVISINIYGRNMITIQPFDDISKSWSYMVCIVQGTVPKNQVWSIYIVIWFYHRTQSRFKFSAKFLKAADDIAAQKVCQSFVTTCLLCFTPCYACTIRPLWSLLHCCKKAFSCK